MSKKVPLYNRDGGVVAYALVDDENYDRVIAKRWALSA